MAETEHIEDTSLPATDSGTKRTTGGRALAALALLISLGAAALAGYAGWLAWQAPKASSVAALQEELAREQNAMQVLRTEFEAMASHTEQQLAALQRSQAQQSDLIAQAAAQSQRAQSQRDKTGPERWWLAEAEYLMRIANHRLLMERDAAAAENLLALADEILAEIDALAYHDVRADLAREMALLRAFKDVDAQSVFLRLEALKGLLDQLPLRLPTYSAPRQQPSQQEAAPPNGSPPMLETLAERLSGLIRFRRHEGEPVRPLLPPRQAEYLQLHLQLALDRAQLAALRHDQEIYRASLSAARDWLYRFVDPTHAATQQLTRELDALLAIDLNVQLPDISGSLSRLRESDVRTAAPSAQPAT